MTKQNQQQEYDELFQKAQNDKHIVGFILAGGRGKGISTENSDYDVTLITTDGAEEQVKNAFPKTKDIEIGVMSLSNFKKYAAVGSPEEWDRYNYAHIKAQIDKTGEIQKIIDEKASLPENAARNIAENALGAYLNLTYRALKNFRDKNNLVSQMDAAESISFLLSFIFAVENRMRPYNKHLEWELTNYPLKSWPFEPKQFLEKIGTIISQGDITTIEEILRRIIHTSNESGFKHVIDDWRGYYFGNVSGEFE